MSEIFSLQTLCRCCHKDGTFKSLQLPYAYNKCVEVYATMLQEAFNITINAPSCEASYSICDCCIEQLREALYFKRQVLECERKFDEYCKNNLGIKFEGEIIYDSGSEDNVKWDKENWNDDVYNCNDIKDGSNIDDYKYADNKSMDTMDLNKNDENKNDDISTDENLTTKIKIEVKPEDAVICKEYEPHENNNPKEGKDSKEVKKSMLKLDLKLEAIVKSENGRYACKVCGEIFRRVVFLRRHIHKTHTDRRHDLAKCKHCQKRSRKEIEKLKDSFECDLCLKTFKWKQTLKRHIMWHNGTNKKCMCEMCGHSFNDKSNLKAHIQTVHLKMRPFHCTVCSKTFTAKKHLKDHYRQHTGEVPYKCEVCTKTYSTVQRLQNHKLVHQSNNLVKKENATAPEITCRVCFAVFPSRGKLRTHARSHIGQREYKCHMCSKDFASRYNLKRHIDEHNGIKRFECEICNKGFTQRQQVKRHKMRFHDPNKIIREKVKCDLCHFHVRNMEKHLNTHNRRPYTCEICSKTYPEQNTLNRHIKFVHQGFKPFPCKLCDKKYVRKSTLQKHSLKTHKIELKEEAES